MQTNSCISETKQGRKIFTKYFLHLMRCLNCWDNKNFWGAKSGPLTHASAIKNWKIFLIPTNISIFDNVSLKHSLPNSDKTFFKKCFLAFESTYAHYFFLFLSQSEPLPQFNYKIIYNNTLIFTYFLMWAFGNWEHCINHPKSILLSKPWKIE